MPKAEPKELRVLVNPYAAIDHEGRPVAVCMVDPTVINPGEHDQPNHEDPDQRWASRHYVGARGAKGRELKAAKTHKIVGQDRTVVHTTPAEHDHTWEHSKDVQTIPNTMYYRSAIKDGVLIAADAKTWAACGCDSRNFQDPELVLAWAKEGAIVQHIAMHGDDPDDERLQTLALHWDRHVEQRHALGQKVSAAAAKAKADAEAKLVPVDPKSSAPPAPAPKSTFSSSGV